MTAIKTSRSSSSVKLLVWPENLIRLGEASSIPGHLDGPPFEVYYDSLTARGELIEDTKGYDVAKEKIFEHFAEEEVFQSIIRQALEIGL